MTRSDSDARAARPEEAFQDLWITRHWLPLINLAAGLFIAGMLLPPVLLRLGLVRAAHAFRPGRHGSQKETLRRANKPLVE